MKCTVDHRVEDEDKNRTSTTATSPQTEVHDRVSGAAPVSCSPSPSLLRLMAAVSSTSMSAMSTTSTASSSASSHDPDNPEECDVIKQEQLLRAAAVLSAVTKRQQLQSSGSSASAMNVLKVNQTKTEPASTGTTATTSSSTTTTVVKADPDDERQKNTSTSDGEKRVNNNNTSAYVSGGGELKFFKDGRCVLELRHRGSNNGPGNQGWVRISKKVYWPPAAPIVKPEETASATSVSDSASNADGASSVSSPWQPLHGQASQVPVHHRAKSKPVKFISSEHSDEVLHSLNFGLRPPACIVSLRKKVRNLRRKRRQPFEAVVVAQIMLRMEAQAVTSRPKRKPFDMDRIKKASRLEAFVHKVQNIPAKKKKGSAPLVKIQTWSASTNKKKPSSTTSSNAPPPIPVNSESSHVVTMGGVTKVRGELFPVTETCTAATLPNVATSQASGKSHAKSKNIEKHQHDRSSSHLFSGSSPASGKALPITPTMARVKEQNNRTSSSIIASSLISPSMQRVKMEIGTDPNASSSLYGAPYVTASSPSQIPHDVLMDPRDSQFISPRKRFLQNFENGAGSPAAKRHRLSTDSRGSGGSEGGGSHPISGSSPLLPRNSSPFNMPLAAASPPRRSSSFSIDSIMSGRDDRDSKAGIFRPVAVPASPARVGEIKMESENRNSSSPSPSSHVRGSPKATPKPVSPPFVPISPYVARSGLDPSKIDPRLAHLAGVAADPRLGLTPTQFPYNAAALSSLYSSSIAFQAAAASHLAAASGLWTPPVATPPSTASSTAIVSSSASVRENTLSTRIPSSSVANRSPMIGGWPAQYRGEPKVEADRDSASPDVPLNLSTRR